MSLTIDVNNADVVTTPAKAAETTNVDGTLTIKRIIDLPAESKIKVVVDSIPGPIELTELSGDSYGTDWTYSTIQTELSAWVVANS